MSEVDDEHDEYDPYTTVTDGERFAPLHTAALSLFWDLAQRYEVAASATFEALPMMRVTGHEYPPITLTPSGGGAPLSVAFPGPESLVLRCGWWYSDVFPSCSCDACNLSLARVAEQFVNHCTAVVAGSFQESLDTATLFFGEVRLSHRLTSASSHGESWTSLPPHLAALMRGTRPSESNWKPWVRRTRESTVGSSG